MIPNHKFSNEARTAFIQSGMSPEDVDAMERVFSMPHVIAALKLRDVSTKAKATFTGFAMGVVVTGAVMLLAVSP